MLYYKTKQKTDEYKAAFTTVATVARSGYNVDSISTT